MIWDEPTVALVRITGFFLFLSIWLGSDATAECKHLGRNLLLYMYIQQSFPVIIASC